VTVLNFGQISVISRKWYEIEAYFQWKTNKKSYVAYRMAPVLVTLKVIPQLQAFSRAIRRTFVQYFTRFQLTARSRCPSATAGLLVTARPYASTVLAVVVCLSVSLSQAGIVSKWLHIVSRKQCHTIAQGLYFSDAKNIAEIRTRSPPTGASNAGGVG